MQQQVPVGALVRDVQGHAYMLLSCKTSEWKCYIFSMQFIDLLALESGNWLSEDTFIDMIFKDMYCQLVCCYI